MKPPRFIFVVGPMRSGTSMAAKLLESHDDYTFGAGSVNDNGENTDFMAKNREVMRCTGGGATRGIPTDACRIASPLRVDLENWLRHIESEQPEGGFVLKDPRACFTLGIWLSLVEDAAVVVCLRDLPCIAESLMRTQRMDKAEATEHIGLYYECALRNLVDYKVPVVFVNYENLLTSPLDTLGPLGRRFHLTDELSTIGAFDFDVMDYGQWHFRPEGE
ncbi:MAG: sulfotransferase [Gemmatimonadales bacterium]|nr:sulfotransferase [Gemmatimonadales bacterium]